MTPSARRAVFLLFGAGLLALLGWSFAGLPEFGHYVGPYGNWAFSPLPKGPIGPFATKLLANQSLSLVVDVGGSGYGVGDIVPVLDAYGSGALG